MAARSHASATYRFGFNGKENDGETGTQDYGMRIYNPALGKFLSVDPLGPKYPFYSPYHFAGNKPINSIDLDGAEDLVIVQKRSIVTINGKPMMRIETNTYTLPHTGIMGEGVLSFSTDENGKSLGYFQKPFTIVGTAKQEESSSWDCMGITDFLNDLLGNGGVNFTSKDGGSGILPHLRKGTFDVETENIDLLIAALGGFESEGGPSLPESKLTTYYEKLLKLNDATEKIKEIDDHVNGEDHDMKKEHPILDKLYIMIPDNPDSITWSAQHIEVSHENTKKLDSLHNAGWKEHGKIIKDNKNSPK